MRWVCVLLAARVVLAQLPSALPSPSTTPPAPLPAEWPCSWCPVDLCPMSVWHVPDEVIAKGVRQVESITLLSADTPGVYDTTQLAVFPRARTVVGVTGSTSSTSTVASVRCARLWPAAGLSRDSVVSRIRRRLEPSPPALSSDSWYEFCTVPGGCVRINRHDATVDGASSGASAAAGVAALVVGMAAVVVAAGTGR